MRTGALLALAVLVAGCPPEKKEGAARVALHKRTGVSFELIPAEGQLPHCLVFTTSSTGVIRQLTMSRENTSYACPAGKPIGNHPYRVPLEEGAVKVQVLFSSQKVNAASVAQQLLDLKDRPAITSMDLRLPGNATIETLTFTPAAEEAPEVGGVVGAGGVTDAGP